MNAPIDIKPQGFTRGAKKKPKPRKLLPIDTRVPLIFVTSFSPAGYEDYGKRFLETFIENWPADCLLAVFYEGQKPPHDDPRIMYFDLLKDADLADFMLRFSGDPAARGLVMVEGKPHRLFQLDAIRFAPKVFALTSPILPSSQWRVWIDADVVTTKKIPDTFFSKLFRKQDKTVAMYLGRPRKVFPTSECGFVAYHTGTEAGRQFLLDFRQNYATGKIFEMPERHDSFVFDVLRKAYEEVGCQFHDIAADYYSQLAPDELTFNEHGHPWPHTRLGEYLTHNKGIAGKDRALQHDIQPPKNVDLQRLCADTSLKNRYEQITRILSVLPHDTIAEVGVALGRTGREMCQVNLARGKKVHYIGFDLFEDLDEDTARRELNGKRVGTLEEVTQGFVALQQQYPDLLTFQLVKGNTRDTLPGFKWPEEGIDLLFLDGGHSVETIASDFEAVKDHAKLIILDDYYLAGQDTTKFGCNTLVDSLKTKTLLPIVDRFEGGQEIQLVATGMILGKPGEAIPMRIKTRNCVPDDEIQNNIANAARYTEAGLMTHVRELRKRYENDDKGLLAAMKAVDPGFSAQFLPSVLRPVETPVLFVGGAPTVMDESLPEFATNWAMIRDLAATHKVVVCKTSYATAFRQGVTPWACFLLDPRDHVAEWVNPPDCRVLYLVASMCHPSTWAHVARPGFKVLGYHAGVGAQEAPTIIRYFGDSPVVHGGTTSSFRGLALLYNLGFRHFKTVGLDSSYPTKPAQVHGRSVKEAHQVKIGDGDLARVFWTDPELIAQSQDAEMLVKLHPDLDIQYLGDGLLQHAQKVYEAMVNKADPLDNRPVEQRVTAWYQLFKTKSRLPEALFIEDVLRTIQKRAQNLADLLAKEKSFEELYG